MHAVETLAVIGYRHEMVPCTLYRQEHVTNHIAVVFPGHGYTGRMPLMYYPRQLLLQSGADVLLVEYNYSERPDFQSASVEERDLWLKTDIIPAYEAAFSQRDYERVTLVGKSIGTRAIGHLLATEDRLPSLSCVWLTPIVRNEQLYAQIKQRPHKALFIVGTNDPHYDQAKLSEVQQATAGQAMVIANADHGLEIAGDIVRSIHILEGIIAAMQKFFA